MLPVPTPRPDAPARPHAVQVDHTCALSRRICMRLLVCVRVLVTVLPLRRYSLHPSVYCCSKVSESFYGVSYMSGDTGAPCQCSRR